MLQSIINWINMFGFKVKNVQDLYSGEVLFSVASIICKSYFQYHLFSLNNTYANFYYLELGLENYYKEVLDKQISINVCTQADIDEISIIKLSEYIVNMALSCSQKEKYVSMILKLSETDQSNFMLLIEKQSKQSFDKEQSCLEDNLLSKINELEETINTLESSKKSLYLKLVQVNNELIDLREEFEQKDKTKRKLEYLLEDLETEKDTVIKDQKEEIQKLKKELEKVQVPEVLLQTIEKYKNKNKDLQEKLLKANSLLSTSTSNVQDQQQISFLKTVIEDLKRKISKTQERE
jgi:chromosome segregation ATPase